MRIRSPYSTRRRGWLNKSFAASGVQWSDQQSWDTTLQSFFAEYRNTLTDQIYTPPPHILQGKQDKRSVVVGRWVATKTVERTPIAWAEVHMFHTIYSELMVFLASPSGHKTAHCLSIFLSGLILQSQPETLLISNLSEDRNLDRLLEEPSEKKTVWTMRSDELIPINVFSLFPDSWWRSASGRRSRNCLSEFENNISILQRQQEKQSKNCHCENKRRWWQIFSPRNRG